MTSTTKKAIPTRGGYAFAALSESGELGSHGMDLRDYFAGQIIAGNLEHIKQIIWRTSEMAKDEDIARVVYDLADAMIAESCNAETEYEREQRLAREMDV